MIDPSIPLMAKGIDGLQMLDDGNKLAQLWQGQKVNAEMNRLYKQAGGDQAKMMELGQQSSLARFLMPQLQEQQAMKQKALLDQQKTQAEIGKTTAETGKIGAEQGKINTETGITLQNNAGSVWGAFLNGGSNAAIAQLDNLKNRGLINPENYQAELTALTNLPVGAEKQRDYALGRYNGLQDPKYTLPTIDNREDNATSIKTTGMNNKTSEYVADKAAATAAAKLEQDGQIAQQRLSFDQAKLEAEQKKGTVLQWGDTMYMVYPDNSVKEISSPTGQPITKNTTAPALKQAQQEEGIRTQRVDAVLPEIKSLLSGASGGYVSTGLDAIGGALGYSTDNAKTTAQLRALSGQLVALMPKMSGPQSDKDVAMYREMAGNLADPTTPVATRLASLQTIQTLNDKYKELNGSQGQGVPYANASSGAKPNALDFFK